MRIDVQDGVYGDQTRAYAEYRIFSTLKNFGDIVRQATVTLTPTPDGGTQLVLTHRGVPKDLIPETEESWREQYWTRIKAHLDREARQK